jgi:tripartite-type tricarboxylate transporter receptor subunit TctC
VPDIPTIAEGGVAGYESSTWHGWFAPGKTPSSIIEKLSGALANAAKMPDVVARLAPDGSQPIGSSPEQLREFVVNDIARWRRVVQAAGVRLD